MKRSLLLILILFVFIANGISQNSRLPYPIIFVHGWVGNETTWLKDEGNWKDFLSSEPINLEYGGVINVCLDYLPNSLHDAAESDVKIIESQKDIFSINKDFYFVNFDIDRNGKKYPSLNFEFFPFNYDENQIQLATGEIYDIKPNDILVVYNQESKDLYEYEYLKVEEVNLETGIVTVERGYFESVERDWGGLFMQM